ncbi:hypothetical protein BR93DRAFT_221662 [Coniochaeta sp. PMI_546]|nr:hypothetical protein BR93DRAFT_221662 [Coniochaeta sp. PMI_546]
MAYHYPIWPLRICRAWSVTSFSLRHGPTMDAIAEPARVGRHDRPRKRVRQAAPWENLLLEPHLQVSVAREAWWPPPRFHTQFSGYSRQTHPPKKWDSQSGDSSKKSRIRTILRTSMFGGGPIVGTYTILAVVVCAPIRSFGVRPPSRVDLPVQLFPLTAFPSRWEVRALQRRCGRPDWRSADSCYWHHVYRPEEHSHVCAGPHQKLPGISCR